MKLKHDELLSNVACFAFNCKQRHYTAGPPSGGFLDQLTVFDRYSYDIGGHAYSGNDIENGVLRGNRPSAASVGALLGRPEISRGPFGPRDPRRAHVVGRCWLTASKPVLKAPLGTFGFSA